MVTSPTRGVPSDDRTVRWLLSSENPSVRYFTQRELLEKTEDTEELQAEQNKIVRGTKVKALLSGQYEDGGFGVHPYQKWTGAHWRLVSLVELGISPCYPPAVKATDLVLDWLLGEAHLSNVPRINGLYRRCASQEGNALAVCSRLGLADDPRVRRLAESLVKWQWPDGGWNCDRREEAHHSSFNESLSTMWGLTEYYNSTSDRDAKYARDRAADFFLKHRIFKSCRTGRERHPETLHGEIRRGIHLFTSLHYPLYWHYDILQALVMLHRAGKLGDHRTEDALNLLMKKRGNDGLWHPGNYYWTLKRTMRTKAQVSNVDIVDWGRRGPNEMITLNAARVLKAAGRFSPN